MENKNTILAFVLAILVLVGWQYYYEVPRQEAQQKLLLEQQNNPTNPVAIGDAPNISTPGISGFKEKAPELADRNQIISNPLSERLPIDNKYVQGSISPIGGRLDDITLSKYKKDAETSESVTLLSPAKSKNSYFVELGWVSAGQNNDLPNAGTKWDIVSSNANYIHLTWKNKNGLVFSREYSLDDHYMFTVKDSVANKGKNSYSLYPYALMNRMNKPETSGIFILHEGPIGVMQDGLVEYDYEDLVDGKIEDKAKGGWLGITDKYWLTALIPPTEDLVKTHFSHNTQQGKDHFQIDYLGTEQLINPGQNITYTHKVFTGAKKVDLLDIYSEQHNIDKFDLAVDFGWFYFLTKPIFFALQWINAIIGNFGISILILTVGIKLIFFPLANKSYKAMSKMRLLQPELVKLRERFADDRLKLNQEMMGLYKREKVNPAAGCLPILIQIPVFFALYKVLYISIDMRHAPFFGWIQDLSAPDPTSIFNLFGMLPFDPPGFLMIGVWPLIMGLSMFLQQKLNPQPADPIQAKMFMFLPVFFTFILASFPAGLVIYWAWNNTLSMAQQWVIMRKTKLGQK